MRRCPAQAAFTLVELLVAAGIATTVTLALMLITSTSMRLIIRNLATNHSHDNVRLWGQRLLRDLHDSASRFVLVNFDGTAYTDIPSSTTAEADSLTGKYISTRANGVRFYEFGGGPYKLTANTVATDTELQFDFSVGGSVPYQPQPGDRLALPLLAREFQITAVLTTPATGSPIGRVQIDNASGVGFKLTTGASYNTTAYFYRKGAYTVYDQQLRYHANFQGANQSTYTVVRRDVTSPKPFALLYDSSGSAVCDQLKLRVSLETADTQYSARQIQGSTTTLQAVIPPRTVPPQINNTN